MYQHDFVTLCYCSRHQNEGVSTWWFKVETFVWHVVNHRHACAAKVIALGLLVCVSVCPLSVSYHVVLPEIYLNET